jgi:MerR family copper efflux transcriptional regulator
MGATTNPARHLPIADASASTDTCIDGCGCHRPGSSADDGHGEDLLAATLMPPAAGSNGEDDKLLQVGDIAKLSGKTVRAIHHYEELGLLQPHARSKGRYRLYDAGSVARVRWINKMHDLGLSLSQIQEIVRAWESASSAPTAMARIRSIYQKKLEETRTQIEHLKSLERELKASIGYLDTCDTCDPAEIVQACSSCHVHEKDQAQPELVAGIHGSAKRISKAASRFDDGAPSRLPALAAPNPTAE